MNIDRMHKDNVVKLENLNLDTRWIEQLGQYVNLRPRDARGLLDMPAGFDMIVSQIRSTVGGKFMTPAR